MLAPRPELGSGGQEHGCSFPRRFHRSLAVAPIINALMCCEGSAFRFRWGTAAGRSQVSCFNSLSLSFLIWEWSQSRAFHQLVVRVKQTNTQKVLKSKLAGRERPRELWLCFHMSYLWAVRPGWGSEREMVHGLSLEGPTGGIPSIDGRNRSGRACSSMDQAHSASLFAHTPLWGAQRINVVPVSQTYTCLCL